MKFTYDSLPFSPSFFKKWHNTPIFFSEYKTKCDWSVIFRYFFEFTTLFIFYYTTFGKIRWKIYILIAKNRSVTKQSLFQQQTNMFFLIIPICPQIVDVGIGGFCPRVFGHIFSHRIWQRLFFFLPMPRQLYSRTI